MNKGKVLALDYGSKHIGIATGDLEFMIAFPRSEISNTGVDAVVSEVVGLCEELSVVLIVLGLPLSMKEGQVDNPILVAIKVLAKRLVEAGYPVEFVDERLTSFEAKNLVGKREKVDSVAAQLILQRYFDDA